MPRLPGAILGCLPESNSLTRESRAPQRRWYDLLDAIPVSLPSLQSDNQGSIQYRTRWHYRSLASFCDCCPCCSEREGLLGRSYRVDMGAVWNSVHSNSSRHRCCMETNYRARSCKRNRISYLFTRREPPSAVNSRTSAALLSGQVDPPRDALFCLYWVPYRLESTSLKPTIDHQAHNTVPR